MKGVIGVRADVSLIFLICGRGAALAAGGSFSSFSLALDAAKPRFFGVESRGGFSFGFGGFLSFVVEGGGSAADGGGAEDLEVEEEPSFSLILGVAVEEDSEGWEAGVWLAVESLSFSAGRADMVKTKWVKEWLTVSKCVSKYKPKWVKAYQA